MRTSRWMSFVLVVACFALGADDAPPADAPRSAEAKQASQAYDKAVREARKAFDASIEKAKKKCIADLNTALDKAMERRDLSEANRIKAQIAAIGPVSIDDQALPELFGRRWLRWSRTDSLNDAVMRFLPDGRIEAERTGFIKWRREGDMLTLQKDVGEGSSYRLRPEIPVLFGPGGPKDGTTILIPED